mgnify:CR=1 FL=1
MSEKKLVMSFKNSVGKVITITIEDPKDSLTEAEIKATMDTIVEKNIFRKNNYEFVEAVSAKIVSTETTEYDLVL